MIKGLDIIITTFNRLDYTRRTVESLISTLPTGVDAPPIFVHIIDNNSDEAGMKNYLEYLAAQNNWHLIINRENLGWGAAVNRVLPYCKQEWIMLANNDVIFHADWFDKSFQLFEKYPQLGLLGLWKHTSHGVVEDLGDMWIKDDMPAVAWILNRETMVKIGALKENGPCITKGGNGEDNDYVNRVKDLGLWVAGPNPDLADHIDGY